MLGTAVARCLNSQGIAAFVLKYRVARTGDPDVDHTIPLYQAWKKTGISAEVHIYSGGGHGFGMRSAGLPVDSWPDRFRDWLGVHGLRKPVK